MSIENIRWNAMNAGKLEALYGLCAEVMKMKFEAFNNRPTADKTQEEVALEKVYGLIIKRMREVIENEM